MDPSLTGCASQRYVSDELTHFIGGDRAPDLVLYQRLLKILKQGWLTHPPHDPSAPERFTVDGSARFSTRGMFNPSVVCFCDIPPGDFAIHMGKYGKFGLAFKKSFLVEKGANPVFYVANNSFVDIMLFTVLNLDRVGGGRCTRAQCLDELFARYHELHTRLLSNAVQNRRETSATTKIPASMEREIRTLFDLYSELARQVFSFCVPFDASREPDAHDNFYMEREWRTLGNLQFALNDVRRVLLPEQYARTFRADCPDYYGQVTFTDV